MVSPGSKKHHKIIHPSLDTSSNMTVQKQHLKESKECDLQGVLTSLNRSNLSFAVKTRLINANRGSETDVNIPWRPFRSLRPAAGHCC